MTVADQNWLQLNRREPQTLLSSLLEYQTTTNGTKSLLEAAQKTIRLASETTLHHELRGADSLIGAGISLIATTSIPASLSDAGHSWAAVYSADGEPLSRSIPTLVKDSADALANCCSCASLFSENTFISAFSQFADGAFDVSDLHLSYGDYSRAADLENSAGGEIKNVFTRTKTYYLLRAARAAISIAAAVLGLLWAASAPWVSGLALLTLSLSASILAIFRDIHEMSGSYPILKFDHSLEAL